MRPTLTPPRYGNWTVQYPYPSNLGRNPGRHDWVGEPGTDAEIAEFRSATYDVTFPVTTKIEVNGPDADPLWVHLRRAAPGRLGPDAGVLYQHLRASRPEVIGTDEVKWNFIKFLVDADGAVVRRYEPHETPEQIAADLARDLATGR